MRWLFALMVVLAAVVVPPAQAAPGPDRDVIIESDIGGGGGDGRCLDRSRGWETRVIRWACNRGVPQQWTLTLDPGGKGYEIKYRADKVWCLTAVEGARPYLDWCDLRPGQFWKVNDRNTLMIESYRYPRQCMAAEYGNSEIGLELCGGAREERHRWWPKNR